MEQTGIIIVAGGGGSRMGGVLPKQFLFLGGQPILARTINNFAAALPGAPLVVVLPAAHMDLWRNIAARFDIAKHILTEGGATRFHSVQCGLAAMPADVELIAVQDGVRPLGSRELILSTVRAAVEHGAAIPVVEAVDSFREIETTAENPVSHCVDRSRLRIVQTPQVFRAELLRNAYKTQYSTVFTDDASVVEQACTPLFLCTGERGNLKITTPEDLVIAEALLTARRQDEEPNTPPEGGCCGSKGRCCKSDDGGCESQGGCCGKTQPALREDDYTGGQDLAYY